MSDDRITPGDSSSHARILSAIGESDAPEQPAPVAPVAEPAPQPVAETPANPAPEAEAALAEEPAAEETPATEEAGEQPSLEPPATWNAEEKEAFKALPLAAQQAAVRLEQGRQARHSRLEQEAAEARKSLETETSQAKQAREQYHARITEIVPALEQQLQSRWAGVDWVKLGAENPQEYTRLRPIFDAEVNAFQSAYAEKQRLDNETQVKSQTDYRNWVAEQEVALVEAIPEWKNEQAARTGITDVRSYLKGIGLAAQQVDTLADAKLIQIARKAMLYDRAQTRISKPAAATPAKAPAVMKPGPARTEAPVNQAAEADRARFRESGSLKDAAALLKRMI